MPTFKDRFWSWYDKNYGLNLTIASGLFLLQVAHLYWLATHVVLVRLTGHDLFFLPTTKLSTAIFSIIDYTEIPALISVSLVYLRDIHHQHRPVRAWLYLFLLNIQWLHLFWLTDEVVIQTFTGTAPIPFHPLAAWVAIAIDYFEVPVIFSTLFKLREYGLSAIISQD